MTLPLGERCIRSLLGFLIGAVGGIVLLAMLLLAFGDMLPYSEGAGYEIYLVMAIGLLIGLICGFVGFFSRPPAEYRRKKLSTSAIQEFERGPRWPRSRR